MNILVINGSPKGENSSTMCLTRAFLAGMGQTAEVVETMGIRPCLGCYACWHQTPGRCVQQDGAAQVLEKIAAAELVIWSTPLYSYGVPSNCKAMLDRLLPLTTPTQYVDEQGRTHHPAREGHSARMLLISGCGFPEREGNFDALIFQFRRMFGQETPMLLCVEAPLLQIPEAAPVAEPYLKLVEQAGAAYLHDGAIPAELQARLDTPMYPPELYRQQAGR